jgi:hypothetical protein
MGHPVFAGFDELKGYAHEVNFRIALRRTRFNRQAVRNEEVSELSGGSYFLKRSSNALRASLGRPAGKAAGVEVA